MLECENGPCVILSKAMGQSMALPNNFQVGAVVVFFFWGAGVWLFGVLSCFVFQGVFDVSWMERNGD